MEIKEARGKIQFELMNIKLRYVEIEDIKLRLQQMEHEASLKELSFEETVQTSRKQNGLENMIIKKRQLELKIKKHETANKRILNAISILDKEEKKIITTVLIDKESKTYTAKVNNMTRKRITEIINSGLDKIAEIYGLVPKTTHFWYTFDPFSTHFCYKEYPI